MTEQEFRELCIKHDLTYAYSDDPRWWRKGVVTHDAIKTAAKSLPHDVVVRIWNEVVDEKILPGSREMFYWS